MGARVFCTVFKCVILGFVVLLEADRRTTNVTKKKS